MVKSFTGVGANKEMWSLANFVEIDQIWQTLCFCDLIILQISNTDVLAYNEFFALLLILTSTMFYSK